MLHGDCDPIFCSILRINLALSFNGMILPNIAITHLLPPAEPVSRPAPIIGKTRATYEEHHGTTALEILPIVIEQARSSIWLTWSNRPPMRITPNSRPRDCQVSNMAACSVLDPVCF